MIRDGDGRDEACAICGGWITRTPLIFHVQSGPICDGCARRLSPAAFDFTARAVHMAHDDPEATLALVSTLVGWLSDATL